MMQWPRRRIDTSTGGIANQPSECHETLRVGTSVRCQRDLRRARQPRASTPRSRSDGPRIRTTSGGRRDCARCVHVARPFLATVSRCLRGDAVRIPDDTTNRAGESLAPPWRHVGHRGMHGGRMYFARLFQRAVHTARGRGPVGLPGTRPQRAGERAELHRPRADAPHPQSEQDRRSAAGAGSVGCLAWT